MQATAVSTEGIPKRLPGKAGKKPSEVSLRVEAGSCDYGLFLRHLRGESDSPQMTPTLRELFDEWVDTGLHADGEEHPFERNPNQMPNAIWICDAFLKKNPSTIMLGSGAHRISFPTASMDTMLSIVFSGEFASPEKWKEYAVQTFIEFLGTPRCLHFAKCRDCSQYFELKKKPKTFYSGGWHCAKCQKQIEANRSTLATMKARTVRQLECYELAAHAWAKWKEDSAEPDSSWILDQATADNQHKVSRLKLKANWITLHRDDIRKMALFLRESDRKVKEAAASKAMVEAQTGKGKHRPGKKVVGKAPSGQRRRQAPMRVIKAGR